MTSHAHAAAQLGAGAAAAPARAVSAQLDSLQALRGVAAVMVMLYHTGTLYAAHTGQVFMGNVFRAGFAGVDVFFVLSGLVIFWAHEADIGQPNRAKRFVVKRAFRLLPVYWVVLLLKVLKDPQTVNGSWGLITVLLLLPTPTPVISVAWTLSYEVIFYALFLLLIAMPRGPWSVAPIAVMALVAVLPTPTFADGSALAHLVHFVFGQHMIEFVFGVAIAWWLRNRGAPSVQVAAALASTGLAAFVAAAAAGTVLSLSAQESLDAYQTAGLHSNWVFDCMALTFGLPAALLIAGVVAMEMRGSLVLPLRRPMAWVGDLSYSLYLTHGFVIHLLLARADFGAIAARHSSALVGAWLAALLLAWVSYRLIERPAMRVGRQLSGAGS